MTRNKPNLETVLSQEPKGWQYRRGLGMAAIVLAVVFAMLFGVNKGVRSEYRKITEAYAEGLDQSGYGLAYYEARMDEHASNLCKIATKSRYGDDFQTQTKAVSDAAYALAQAGQAGEKYDAIQDLIDAVDSLNLEMQDYALDPEDENLRAQEYHNFTDQFYKARNIAVDFNELVRRYNDQILGSFPASVLAFGAPTAEEFS